MKSLKKYVMGLVAMTIAIGAVTLMSMSAGVEVEKEKVSTSRWFNVISYNSSSPDQKSTQIIGTELSSPPSNSPNPNVCSTTNLGVPCAVEFEMDSEIPASELENLTVDQIESDHSTTAKTYARKNP